MVLDCSSLVQRFISWVIRTFLDVLREFVGETDNNSEIPTEISNIPRNIVGNFFRQFVTLE